MEFATSQMERRELRPAPRRGRRLAESRAEKWSALRRVRTSGRKLHLVSGRAQIGQDWAARRRALRWSGFKKLGSLPFSRRAGRHQMVFQQYTLAAAMVQRNQGTRGQLSSRPALQRRRRGLRKRSGLEPDRQSLQRQPPATSRQNDGRV